jgi:hypothetical protein
MGNKTAAPIGCLVVAACAGRRITGIRLCSSSARSASRSSSDLGPGDLVWVGCARGDAELLTAAMLATPGVGPERKVLDLGPRMCCRECDERGPVSATDVGKMGWFRSLAYTRADFSAAPLPAPAVRQPLA